MTVSILHGKCELVMPTLEAASFHACVTDPPYLIGFMGKQFDRQHRVMNGANQGQRMQAWHFAWATEVFRILKPGAFISAFGGERSFHRLYSALEDAGFEPRTTVLWLSSQGFPKSLNVSKELEKMDWCRCDD